MATAPDAWMDRPELGVRIQLAQWTGGGECTSFDVLPVAWKMLGGDGVVWLNVQATDLALAERFLVDDLGLHPLAVEDALSEGERPSVREYDHTLFMTILDVRRTNGEERFVEVGAFLSKGLLITVATEEVPVLSTWFRRWTAKPAEVAPHEALLLHAVFDEFVDQCFPIVDAIEDEVDDLEDSLHEGVSVTVSEILRVKRRLHALRRSVSPMRDTLNTLLRRDIEQIPESARMYFQDVYDHTLRVLEVVDVNRDVLSDVLDAHLSVVSNNLNHVMKALTVLSTVLMSMALVTGLYGMNFVHMPELKWPYGYAFAGSLMLFVGVLEVWVFRKIRWI